MNDEDKIRLTIGALLHDIGKVVYRAGMSGERHSQSGAAYLAGEAVNLKDKNILDCVRYHHARDLKGANLPADSDAYIVYMADNIASATNRREQMETPSGGFERTLPLSSIFNLLNGNNGQAQYNPHLTNVEESINFPATDVPSFDEGAYKKIIACLTDSLKGIEWSADYVHSLLDVLEANLAFVPSSTNLREVADISLFSHVKLTAAFAASLKDYLIDNGERDYRRKLFVEGKKFYDEKAFLLTTLDLSGIQKFIYTINSDGALKALRARSFYLDFLLEHIAHELIDALGLTRANLLYAAGGRADLILANTAPTRRILTDFTEQINAWFEEHFDIDLFMAVGYADASCNDFMSEPRGSYADLRRVRGENIAAHKAHRYSAAEIIALNNRQVPDDTRECKACRRADTTNEDDLCHICAALKALSVGIMSDKYDFVAAIPNGNNEGLPLPGGYSLTIGDEKDARDWQKTDGTRIYGKNRFFTGKGVATRLWVGDYHTGETFAKLAEQATGIKRLGVLRADVDNLGAAFAYGFRRPDGDERFVTISRTTELSQQLSMFFKLHLKKILANPQFTMTGIKKEKRHAAVVYSGGDDLFVVGAWDDVIELAIDLRNGFAMYTEETLTISAGIGIYHESYPISVMAEEVAVLADKSKNFPGKNAVTLPGDDGTYSWDTLEKLVIGEKLRCLDEFFALTDSGEQDRNERGKNFLYNLLNLLRGRGEKINLARYVYLLSRMEPDKDAEKDERERYRVFADKMYRWNLDEEDARQLETAILLYAYLTREREDKDHAEGE